MANLTKKGLLVRLFAAILTAIMLLTLSGCDTTLNAGDTASSAGDTDLADLADLGLMTQGYTSVIFEGESEKGISFLVCGTDGRLDRIFADGTLENIPLPVGDKSLTSVLKGDGITLVGGISGALVYSQDGKEFKLSKGAEGEHILGMAQFKGEYYACTYGGNILSSKDGISWKTVKRMIDKPLIGIAADENYIMAITNDTNVFISADGKDWDQQNYNEVYGGLAERLSFSSLLNLDGSFIVLGYPVERPDEPYIMFTVDAGETWMYNSLVEINGKPSEEYFPMKINSLRFFEGETLAACDGGRILTITSCPTCNIISDASSATDLRCMEIYGDTLLVAGTDFMFEILDTNGFRQNKISAEQAKVEMDYGAIMIDVRTEEEYNEGHIPGSLNIPVDEIESRLPSEVPYTDEILIFYCASGGRSQTALETAQQLGYTNVFNLGGLSDWPYEIE